MLDYGYCFNNQKTVNTNFTFLLKIKQTQSQTSLKGKLNNRPSRLSTLAFMQLALLLLVVISNKRLALFQGNTVNRKIP